MTGISLFCGLWDREQNLDREIVLVSAVCGSCLIPGSCGFWGGREAHTGLWLVNCHNRGLWLVRSLGNSGELDYPGDSGWLQTPERAPDVGWWLSWVCQLLTEPLPLDRGAMQMTLTRLWPPTKLLLNTKWRGTKENFWKTLFLSKGSLAQALWS